MAVGTNTRGRYDYEFRDYPVRFVDQPPPPPPLPAGTLLTETGLALLTESEQPLIL